MSRERTGGCYGPLSGPSSPGGMGEGEGEEGEKMKD